MLSYCSSFNTFSDDGHFGIIREDLVDDLDLAEEEEIVRLKSIFAQSGLTYDSMIPINEIQKIFGKESVFVTLPFILKGATDGTLNDALRWCMMLPITPDPKRFIKKSLELVDTRFQDSVMRIADTQLRDHFTNFLEAQGRCSAQVVTRNMGTPGELVLVEERMGLEFVVGWVNNEYGLAHGIFVDQ